MKVEVCYALESKQTLIEIDIPFGSTVIKAILASGVLDLHPDVELNGNVGIFSKKIPLNHVLQEGDRVEIYRPLFCTPNERRLLRAK